MIRILIAEDEMIERKSLCFLLGKYFKDKIEIVGEVINGRDAIDKTMYLSPDIILMDINMPEMDGLQASEQIKKLMPRCEIIIMTAYSYFDYAKKAITLGVTDYLVKPYPSEQFCESIERLIEKVDQKIAETNQLNILKKKTESLSYFIEREMIMELVHSRDRSTQQLIHYKNVLGIQDEEFICVVYRTLSSDPFTEDTLDRVIERYKAITPNVVGYFFLSEIVILLFSNKPTRVLENREINKIGSQIQQQLEKSIIYRQYLE
ncbi:response regulator [Cytobacillus sp. S13-E01]|uniref:response regulator n=1 Tax=Cytobacillus sp. S13-E01 TaxID=3031326 RepID=UPI0023D8AA68|nr:response regulator [Cytobacillus sp. S13-E01]MDF0725954.1 response regulator [Cytobacillus sp. S13-E01]